MVDDVLAFVDAVGLDRIVLMGLSMGGINAFLFAAANPVRVERLVILDIGPEVASAGTQRIMASIAEADVFTSEEEAIAQARAANPRPTDEILRHRVVHTLRPLSDGTFTFKWDKALRDGSAVRDDHGVDERWEAWRSITCPILLVRGADSDILSPDTAERMMKENPNATLAVVPDCGHSITLDRPDGFLEVLAPWLDEYNQRSASASG
jgi:pimeloyl-ACP methyl ester carboxylesterase